MGKCKHLIDISPYDPLCDHPCRLYGGGAVEAECETCQYHIEDLERENAKLREYVTELEAANLDVTARLADYIGQYDPTDAFVAEVKAENAKLLDQKADAYNDMVIARLDADELQAENAKLRELCRHLYACNQYCDREDSNGGCSVCPYQPLECDCGFEERLLELGIEVVV